MLKKSQRLTTSQLERVLKDGKVAHTALFTVRALNGGVSTIRPIDKPAKFAVVVSKKVAKTAVGRNFLRRRIYEVLGLKGCESGSNSYCLINQVKNGSLVAIFAKNRSEKFSLFELKKQIGASFLKVGVL